MSCHFLTLKDGVWLLMTRMLTDFETSQSDGKGKLILILSIIYLTPLTEYYIYIYKYYMSSLRQSRFIIPELHAVT